MTMTKESDAQRYECMKHKIYMDEAHAECRDPDLYCKFRPSCMIHFMAKEKGRERSKRVG